MNDPDITKFIVVQLKNGRRPDDVILAVCERTRMQWPEAKQFVQRLHAEHQNEIASHQSRFLVPVGIMITVGGLAIAIVVSIATLDGWIIFLLRLPIPYLGNLLLFGLGICMTIGGVTGLARMKR